MIPEATERYEQRTKSLSKQLIKTLRRVFRNEWEDYATLMMHRSVNTFGHAAAIDMYDAILQANRNGSTKIQATTNNNQCVYIRSRPYFQALRGAAQIARRNASSSSQSSSSRTATSTIQDSQRPQRVVVWAAIRRLAIYRRIGALNTTKAKKPEEKNINLTRFLTLMLLRTP